MNKIEINLRSNFNNEAEEISSWDAYQALREQILKSSEEILRNDPYAEIIFSINLDAIPWVKTRFLHKITEEVFDIRRRYEKLNPYIVADRADNSRWQDFREKFQTIYQIDNSENQLIITERLRTQADEDANLLGIHGEDEVYNRDRPPIIPKSSPR